MDFSFSDDQQELAGLAERILADRVTHERLRELEGSGWVDTETWAHLASAGLAGVCIPEAHGGLGFGLVETALVLREVGAVTATVPAYPALVLGALPIVELGTDEQRSRLLPGVAAGEVLLTAGLEEPHNEEPAAPATTATVDGDVWRLTGQKTNVPLADRAARVLVPAATGQGEVGLFLVDPAAGGVTLDPQTPTHLEPQSLVSLDGAPVAAADVVVVGPAGVRAHQRVRDLATAGLCALGMGIVDGALKLLSSYVAEREQFGVKLATFQAVGQRAADSYIDAEAVKLSAWQAIWRMAEGLPYEQQLAVAKTWLADGGQRVVHAAQHLHGGIGVDVDYPLHRYFRWAKHLELALGSSTRQLLSLGGMLAEEPV